MDEATRRAHLERLCNPKMPNPFFSNDYGVPVRELPSRRTLRERVRALLLLRRRVR